MVNVKLSASKLNKLKSATKNATADGDIKIIIK